MADTTYYIRSDSPDDLGTGTTDTTSGADRAFKTPAGAEAALQGTIDSGDRIICEMRAGTYEEFTIDGSTVNGEWVWRALDGHRHLGVDGDGVDIQSDANSTSACYCQDTDCTFEDLQFQGTNTTTGCRGFRSNAARSTLRRCIFGPVVSTAGDSCFIDATEGKTEACLVLQSSSTARAFRVDNNLSHDSTCLTIVKANADGFYRNSSGASVCNIHNCVSYGSGQLDFDIPGTNVVGDYNASSDTTAPDDAGNSAHSISDPFTDYTGGDYTISGTGSALYDAGSASNRPTTDSYGNSNRDITNTEYVTDDIGCFAYIAAGGTTITATGLATAFAAGAATILNPQTITGTGLASAFAAGGHDVDQLIEASALASGEAFGAHSLDLTVEASAKDTDFVAGTVSLDQLIEAQALDSGFAAGSAVVSVGGAAQTITAEGLETAFAAGSSSLNQLIEATALASAFGAGTAQLNLGIALTGLPGGEAFGSHLISLAGGPQTIVGAGLESAFAAGDVTLDQLIEATGLPTAEAVGDAVLGALIGAVSVESGFAAGDVALAQLVEPAGLASEEAFGDQTLVLSIAPSGLATAEAFGTLELVSQIVIQPTGLPSAFGAGTIVIVGGVTAQVIAAAIQARARHDVSISSGAKDDIVITVDP